MPADLVPNFILKIILILLWGSAAWLWLHRDHPDKLSKLLPVISKYRKNRLHPLFRSHADVLGLAGRLFGIGLLY